MKSAANDQNRDVAGSYRDERGPLLSEDFVRRLESLDLVSRKIIKGKLRGERRSRQRGHSVEFDDYRPYSPGDDLRFLDWNIFGRLDRLFIKLFLEEQDLAFEVLVDSSGSMDYGAPNKFRYAQKLAAALASVGLSNDCRVSITALNDQLGARMPALRGRRSLPRMLRFVEDLEPAGGTDLGAAVHGFARQKSGKGLVVLISDFLDRGGCDAALRALMARRCEVFCLQVLSPQELEPSLAGDLELVDVEDGDQSSVTISAPLLASYRRVVGAFIDRLRRDCTGRGIGFAYASTGQRFEQLVLGTLRNRGLLR
jgi:uncharacterized protein (DUF58 family)